MHTVQEFGVKLDLGPEGAAECLDKAGITFMFAPRFHPAMKAVVPVRRSLKVRTAFNVLGPMLNPAGAKYGLVGVYNSELARLMAEALQVLVSPMCCLDALHSILCVCEVIVVWSRSICSVCEICACSDVPTFIFCSFGPSLALQG